MLSNDWTTALSLAHAARVCACANCKRLANRAAQALRATLTFTRSLEALSDTAVVPPKPLVRQQGVMEPILTLEASVFCAASAVYSSN